MHIPRELWGHFSELRILKELYICSWSRPPSVTLAPAGKALGGPCSLLYRCAQELHHPTSMTPDDAGPRQRIGAKEFPCAQRKRGGEESSRSDPAPDKIRGSG